MMSENVSLTNAADWSSGVDDQSQKNLPSVSAREAQILKIIYRLFLRNICSLTNSDVGKRKIQMIFFILNNVH